MYISHNRECRGAREHSFPLCSSFDCLNALLRLAEHIRRTDFSNRRDTQRLHDVDMRQCAG